MAAISILWIALFGVSLADLLVWRGARHQHLDVSEHDRCARSADTAIAAETGDANAVAAIDPAFLDNACCMDGRMALTIYLIVRAQENSRQQARHDPQMRSGRQGYISQQNGLLS